MTNFTHSNECESAAKPISVTQVSTADIAGGAERVALDIHMWLLEHGFEATLAVGRKYADYPHTPLIPNEIYRNPLTRAINKLAPESRGPHTSLSPNAIQVRRALKLLASPSRTIRTWQGYDDFDFPGTRHIPSLSHKKPDVLHLHNLHGNYFDLRELPVLCAEAPVMLTAHDTWLASGHCAYSVDCHRYHDGCGQCEHLEYLPRAHGDRTHANWLLKRSIYQDPRTHIHLVSPSQWTIDILENSIFGDAIASSTVIPNGVDTSVFHPVENRNAQKIALGIDPNSVVLTYSLASETNPFKDIRTIRETLPIIAQKYRDRPITYVAIGGTVSSGSHIEGVEMKYTGYLSNPADVAAYLQVADVHLHAAHAEVFCLAIIEAEACGAPVVTANVGGTADTLIDGMTGILVPRSAPQQMAEATVALLSDPVRRAQMGRAAAQHALDNLTRELMVQRYCETYQRLAK